MKNLFVLMFIFLSAFSFIPSSEASEETWEERLRSSFPFARILHATETIGGDQVLLFGGYDGELRNNETWIYDLGNKTWKLKSPTLAPSARINHSMADIGGDRVILFGGWDGADDGETWIYDRSDNTWTEVATGGTAGVDKPGAREHSALVHIGDGMVLLFGGNDTNSFNGETWVYDVGLDTWSQKLPTTSPSARDDHAMAYIGDDQVLLFGGGPTNGETWVYDLSDNAWTEVATGGTPGTDKPTARKQHEMTHLDGDQVLLFGGNDGDYNGETWVYDLSAGTWTEVSIDGAPDIDKPAARSLHAMAHLGGDKVLLFGGNVDGDYSNETWVYELSTSSWHEGTLSVREHFGLADIGDGKVLLFGGNDDYSRRGDTWVYDLSNNSWSQKLPTTSPFARDDHAMASIGDDQVLLFGGSPTNGETWVYDLSDNTWTEVATGGTPGTDKPTARKQHEMAHLGGDQVLLFGGNDGDFNGETWVYDLSAGTWTEVAIDGAPDIDKPSGRYAHAMAHLGGDEVLLYGGRTAGDYSSETWVYDFSENTWSKMSPDSPPFARILHAMAYRGTGQALLFGGYNGETRNGETWVYDLADNTWNPESPSSTPSARINHGMAYLGSDQVLLFGGYDGANDGETWIYSADVPFPIFGDGFEADDSP